MFRPAWKVIFSISVFKVASVQSHLKLGHSLQKGVLKFSQITVFVKVFLPGISIAIYAVIYYNIMVVPAS